MTAKVCTHNKIVSKGIISELRKISSGILDSASVLGYEKDDLFAVQLALEEAVVNAVKHGNKSNAEKDVTVEYDINPHRMEISITDQGEGFNPIRLADPRCGDNIYKTNGRGVLLIKSYMDTVEYRREGRCVYMVKLNSKNKPSA